MIEVNEALCKVENDVTKPRSDDETPDDQSHSINTPPLSSTDQVVINNDGKFNFVVLYRLNNLPGHNRCFLLLLIDTLSHSKRIVMFLSGVFLI